MKSTKIFFYTIVAALFFKTTLFAQKDKNTLGTETINVIKPNLPTVFDAPKIQEIANPEDEETEKKEIVKYTIMSVPVASIFIPTKGIAANVDAAPQELIFDNFATLGFGSYASIVAKLFMTKKLSDSEQISGAFQHNSSQANIKNIALNSKYFDSKINLTYSNKTTDMDWNASIGYQHQVYNWYGLPVNFAANLSDFDRNRLFLDINPSHTFHDFGATADTEFKENIFAKISLNFNRFWDSYGSIENRFSLKPVFSIKTAENAINLKTNIDYIGTTFEKFYQADFSNPLITNFENKNSYFLLSANPNYTILKDDLTLNLGAEITFLNTISNQTDGTDFGNKSSIYIYPKVTASYKVVGDLMIAFGGAEGGLKHNSYKELANQNNFVSPTLTLAPTDALYDIYFGLRGKLAENLGYNVKASYLNEKNKALFKNNFYDQFLNNSSYENGNSFGVVYDDVRTLKFDGSIKATISDKVDFGIHGSFANLSNSIQPTVWNAPTLEFDANLEIKFNQKWSAGTNIFFIGERKDQIAIMDDILVFPPSYTNQTVSLNGFFDANLFVNYKYNSRISGFFNANNIGNQAYQKWINIPVQQLQLVLGANYKFDF